MEALGVAANIVGILQLTATVIKYLDEVQGASKDGARILIEISSLYGLLFSLKELVDRADSGESWSATARSLGEPNGPLAQFESALQRLETHLEPVAGWRKAGRALTWPLKKAEVSDILHTIERQKALFILAIQNDHVELSRAIESNVFQIKQSVAVIEKRAQDDAETKILDWLSPLKPERKHRDVCDRRLADTGQWLLESKEFQSWCGDAQSKKVLWCHGIPGAGKTILASLIIDKVKSGFPEGVAFFYCDYRDQDDHSAVDIIASLLKQLAGLKSPLPRAVLELHKRFGKQRDPPQFNDLEAALLSACEELNRVFIIVDALDECADRHRRSLLQSLNLLTKASARLLVTSRPVEDIKKAFAFSDRLEIQARGSDIRTYLTRKLDFDLDAADLIDKTLQEEIISTISEGSQGMFLLPALQIQAILEQTCRAEIRQAIRTMPKALNDTFAATLSRISAQPKPRSELAMNTLLWISHARRPLRVDELRQALTIRLGQIKFDRDYEQPVKLVLDCCVGLVAVDHESSTIRLVHFSLQEFLQAERQNLFPNGQSEISKLCLTYLMFGDFDGGYCSTDAELTNRFQAYPFLMYASHHWGHHAGETQDCKVQELALNFLLNDFNLLCASQVEELPEIPSARVRAISLIYPPTGLQIAASLGLREIVKMMITQARRDYIHRIDNDRRTALHRAALNGHKAVVRDLILARLSVHAEDDLGRTPLFLAASNGHDEITELLLKNGAEIDATSVYGWTALQKAADNGHERVIKLLLNHGARIDSRSNRGVTALNRASGRGHDSIVTLLLNRGSDIEAETEDDWTLLHGAASSGRHSTVGILLDRKANIHACTLDGRTPLHRACRGGHKETTALLPEKGSNVLARDDNKRTPLHEAAQSGSIETVKMLLDHGASKNAELITAKDADFNVPYQVAALSGHHELTICLREKGYLLINTDATDLESVIDRAADTGNWVHIKELIETGTDLVSARSQDGLNTLHRAAFCDQWDICTLLLEQGTNPNVTSDYGWTPLHSAARAGNESVVRGLLEYKADIRAATNDEQTVLHKACQNGNEATVRLLLDEGADLMARDERGRTPLHEAAEYGHENIATILLSHGADLFADDADYQTPQQLAAGAGQHALLEFFRQQEWVALNRARAARQIKRM